MTKQRQNKFWETKSLNELSSSEWEALCDGCGRCCLHKVKDEKADKIAFLGVSCQFLDTSSCRCLVYEARKKMMPDCIVLSPDNIGQTNALPATCAYRRLAEGKPLKWWHPLVSGDANTVHQAGISVQDRVVSGHHVHPDDLSYYNDRL